jgi:hypothetical protein
MGDDRKSLVRESRMNKEVGRYIEKQQSPQKEIVQKLRMLILTTFPDVKEEFKMGVPWYECKYYIVALRDHVNVGFSVKDLSTEERGLFEGNGKTMRHIKVWAMKDLDEEKVVKLLRIVYGKQEKKSLGKSGKD